MIAEIIPHADYSPYFKHLWPALVPGDVAEFGSYRGGSSRQLAELSSEYLTKRTVYAFDTFAGLPAADFNPDVDIDNPGGFTPEATAAELFAGWPSITPVVGRFADTLPKFDPAVRFAFCYIDSDYYESTRQVLDWLPGRLSNGAVLLFDDYKSHKGVRAAIHEFAEKWALEVKPIASSGAVITWRAR
jgi:hypothetical protein